MSGINPVIGEILAKRGVSGQKEIEEFLTPKPQLTYDPFLLPNMKEGVDFVLSAVREGRKICIYGDYDVDGISGTALLYNFLIRLTNNLTFYIPSRFEDGYGLNTEALLQLKKNGVDTVITVDCGAVSKKEVEYAKTIGLELMVTDHHNMEENTSPDCIVINPKHFNSKYPFPELCGCAVAFKLMQAVVRTENLDRSCLIRSLDLVAIATVADVVPLISENRTMVKYGLKELNRGSRKAMRIMMARLNLEPGTIDSYKIGFVIGPHMNAAGRISDAKAVVEMLISDNNSEINTIVDTLIKHNLERKSIQEKCFAESVKIIDDIYSDVPFIVVRPDFMHEGIAGIVAGKIKEKYNRPTIVLSVTAGEEGNTLLKGSGRSIGGVDLISMLLSHEELFIKLGGHSMAAGFTIPAENESALIKALNEDMMEELGKSPDLFARTVNFDVAVGEGVVEKGLTEDLKLLEPFGVGNPKPIIKLDHVKIANIRYMGSENQHVKFAADNFDCILFGSAWEKKDLLKEGNHVILYGSPDINVWNGKESLQFLIKDMNIREG